MPWGPDHTCAMSGICEWLIASAKIRNCLYQLPDAGLQLSIHLGITELLGPCQKEQ
ncbi:hypothetical protein CGRA01v4_09070 [Colletotrichum graminicola]|nr:hypothetical protein CGRA01v4_09070 [Colletotrichum graminicola]